jgi:hypothetical protein
MRHKIVSVALTGLVAGVLSLAGPAAAAGGGSWHSTEFTLPGGTMSITDVAASGPSNAWAVGNGSSPPSSPAFGLVNRWNGRGWQPVRLSKSVASIVFQTVATSSASNVWAFGEFDQYAYWNGRHWSTEFLPLAPHHVAVVINAAVATGNDQVWALGYALRSSTESRPYIAELTRHGWRLSKLPSRASAMNTQVIAVSAASAKDVWALLGSTSSEHPLPTALLHWNGRWWSLVRFSAVVAGGDPAALVALSPSSVWIEDAPQYTTGNVLWHWDGHVWTSVANPQGIDLGMNTFAFGMAADGHGGLWVLAGGAASIEVPLGAWDYRNGQWTSSGPMSDADNPGLAGLVSVPHSSSLWAYGSGGAAGSTTSEGIIEGYTP